MKVNKAFRVAELLSKTAPIPEEGFLKIKIRRNYTRSWRVYVNLRRNQIPEIVYCLYIRVKRWLGRTSGITIY